MSAYFRLQSGCQALRSSLGMLSGPFDLPFFSFAVATLTSRAVMGISRGLGGPSNAGRGPSLESVNCASKPRLSAGRTRCS